MRRRFEAVYGPRRTRLADHERNVDPRFSVAGSLVGRYFCWWAATRKNETRGLARTFMRKFAWVAILPWFASACGSAAVNGQDDAGDQGRSPGGADAATDSSSTASDASNVMSEVGSHDASVPASDAALPRACDSGGPLALKSVWNLPAVAPSGAAVDGSGNVYVTGTYTGTVTFGTTTLTGPTTAGSGDMFLVKYDGSGNVLFANSYGTMTGVYDPPVIAVD